mmetsp:Transcript_10008/g.31591  ORF Transcript_10008/g.31591 Transcript_10008/m.31591 type:complete len:220 (+) Transcript_10008:344-1003(+)
MINWRGYAAYWVLPRLLQRFLFNFLIGRVKGLRKDSADLVDKHKLRAPFETMNSQLPVEYRSEYGVELMDKVALSSSSWCRPEWFLTHGVELTGPGLLHLRICRHRRHFGRRRVDGPVPSGQDGRDWRRARHLPARLRRPRDVGERRLLHAAQLYPRGLPPRPSRHLRHHLLRRRGDHPPLQRRRLPKRVRRKQGDDLPRGNAQPVHPVDGQPRPGNVR